MLSSLSLDAMPDDSGGVPVHNNNDENIFSNCLLILNIKNQLIIGCSFVAFIDFWHAKMVSGTF